MKLIDASIVVTRYKEPNYLLFDTLHSLSKQEWVWIEVLVLDQFYNKETHVLTGKLSSDKIEFKYIVIEARWLSFARNYWLKKSISDFILFIDSDAIAMSNWAYEIISAFKSNNNIRVVWTKILPKWNWKRNIFTFSNYFRSTYSLLDLWDDVIKTTKVIWASFGIYRNDISDVFFNENLWRKNWILLWWEETDFCDQVTEKWYCILYSWRTFVLHQINKERLSYRWLIKRVIYQWVGRALKGWKPNPNPIKKNIFDYIYFPVFLFFYLYWYFYWLFYYKRKLH